MTMEEAVQALERVLELTNDAGKVELRAVMAGIREGLQAPEKPKELKIEKVLEEAEKTVKPEKKVEVIEPEKFTRKNVVKSKKQKKKKKK